MKELIKILEEFDKQRNALSKSPDWNEDAVAKCFEPYARKILCGGYFLVNGRYIIDLGYIELYYHEEDRKETQGKIKDPIMYHTNDRRPYSTYYKGIGKYPYFKYGSFNLHQSGVDITFENPDEEYRASFLIRSYRVMEITNNETAEDIKEKLRNPVFPEYNPHSTHIFDDMFPNGVVFGNDNNVKIKWVICEKGGEIKTCKRINVPDYKKDENGKYCKGESGKYCRVEGSKETRNWGFRRIGIKEHK